jgi:hypothetical protein
MGDYDLLESLPLSDAEQNAIRDDAVHSADFMICRNRIRIRGNTPFPIERFSFMYDPFRLPDQRGEPSLTISCSLGDDARGRNAVVIAGEKVFRVRDKEVIDTFFPLLAYLVFANIRSHYMVHAGCVSRNGQAIIISGDSGMGKTTLTSHLISRGMGFLSDELAPIHRATGTVDPFPLRLGIRPGPAQELVRDLPGTSVLFDADDPKKLVDARALGARPAEQPLPLHAVVFLSQHASAEVSTPRKFKGAIQLHFMAMTEDFRRDLLERTGATLLSETASGSRLVSLVLSVPDPSGFLPVLNETVARHGIPLAGINVENLDPRDFAAKPQLIKLPAVAGVIELIKKMPSHNKAELIRAEFGGKMPLLIKEVSGLTDRVTFYKLKPGRLDKMIELIEGVP